MRRLHVANNDLDWLPKRYRYLRGAIIGGMIAAVAVVGLAGHGIFLSYGMVYLGAGAAWIGDRVSKGVVRKRLGKLARGDVDVSRLASSEDGEFVHVRGTVRAQELLPSLTGGAPGVYRRVRAVFVRYTAQDAIEERAVDFQLVDAEGNVIGIEVDGARWLVHDEKAKAVAEFETLFSSFEELGAIQRFMNARRARLAKRTKGSSTVLASEMMLRPGDEVEVVGYKSRQIDPTMADRMFRDTPMRATLRSGKELPLILSRVSTPA